MFRPVIRKCVCVCVYSCSRIEGKKSFNTKKTQPRRLGRRKWCVSPRCWPLCECVCVCDRERCISVYQACEVVRWCRSQLCPETWRVQDFLLQACANTRMCTQVHAHDMHTLVRWKSNQEARLREQIHNLKERPTKFMFLSTK